MHAMNYLGSQGKVHVVDSCNSGGDSSMQGRQPRIKSIPAGHFVFSPKRTHKAYYIKSGIGADNWIQNVRTYVVHIVCSKHSRASQHRISDTVIGALVSCSYRSLYAPGKPRSERQSQIRGGQNPAFLWVFLWYCSSVGYNYTQ